jgi:hypothetical protein
MDVFQWYDFMFWKPETAGTDEKFSYKTVQVYTPELPINVIM